MSRSVKILVVDKKGYGVSGQRVKYDGTEYYTDSEGEVTLIVGSGTAYIYVNGFTAYSGSSNNLGQVETFNTCGEQVWLVPPISLPPPSGGVFYCVFPIFSDNTGLKSILSQWNSSPPLPPDSKEF